jgi:hypothetical protein
MRLLSVAGSSLYPKCSPDSRTVLSSVAGASLYLKSSPDNRTIHIRTAGLNARKMLPRFSDAVTNGIEVMV